MANPFTEQFIKFWKANNFSGWNETDIREEFIAPLLKLLGYSKNTVDHIIREQNLNLQEKYHRIGRKQIAIDYIPTVRLKKFWIIEAKPGDPKKMDYGDFLQAHFYAIHPEISARFIVMINGWEIRVYDALNSNDWENYILLVNQENCGETFEELIEILGSNSMGAYLRKYILSTVRDSLLAEIDVEAAESLKKDVFRIYSETLPIIRKNAHDFQLEAWRNMEKEAAETLTALPIAQLLIQMDIPIEMRAKFGMEYARRIINANDQERTTLYRKLKQTCYGRPHNIFRVQMVATLLDLIRSNIAIFDGQNAIDLKEELISLANYNMSYWEMNYPDPIDSISFAICHLDNICSRLAYKSARRFAMEPLKELVNAKLTTFSVKDLLISPPTVARELVGSINLVQHMLWQRAMEQDARAIWNNIWLMEDLERIIEVIPEVPYADGDRDMLGFNQYGKDLDTLRLGTWSLLDGDRKLLSEKVIDMHINDILSLSRDDARCKIPAPIQRPANWVASNKAAMASILEKMKGFNDNVS